MYSLRGVTPVVPLGGAHQDVAEDGADDDQSARCRYQSRLPVGVRQLHSRYCPHKSLITIIAVAAIILFSCLRLCAGGLEIKNNNNNNRRNLFSNRIVNLWNNLLSSTTDFTSFRKSDKSFNNDYLLLYCKFDFT